MVLGRAECAVDSLLDFVWLPAALVGANHALLNRAPRAYRSFDEERALALGTDDGLSHTDDGNTRHRVGDLAVIWKRKCGEIERKEATK